MTLLSALYRAIVFVGHWLIGKQKCICFLQMTRREREQHLGSLERQVRTYLLLGNATINMLHYLTQVTKQNKTKQKTNRLSAITAQLAVMFRFAN